MTNKEAIKKLKQAQAEYNDNYVDYCGMNEAYNLAIKALKILEVDDIDIDGTYWLYYDDNGNLRENEE